MKDQSIFWMATTAYGLHIMEEFFYDWKSWANHVLKLPVDWTGFYITNITVLFFGICCSSVGWAHPAFALAFPALMLINGLFFHVLPVWVTRKFSPGLITALLLFFPVGLTAFHSALAVGVSSREIVVSFLMGMALMGFPIFLLKTKNHRLFSQVS
jgi:hypothetical protein